MKEQDFPTFPDKKHPVLNYDEVTKHLIEAERLAKEFEPGQKEATWIPRPEYPNLPIAVALMSDIHYGSTNTDYKTLEEHLKIVEDTPNFYMATNGDHIDNFNAVIHPTGMTEDPIPPQLQARAFMQRLLELDRKSKIACLGQGNHDDFGFAAGQDFYQSFMADFQAPIFTQGGILNMVLPGEKYRMILNHQYWGKSKINITNAPKRLIEYEGGGNVDIGWLGHTHQSSYEHFTKGSREQLAVVSGTYKDNDPWAAKHGISGREGDPGITVVLWPHEKKMQAFKDMEVAQQFILGKIFQYEEKHTK